MRTNAFIIKVNRYGELVTIYNKPVDDIANRCTCWADGYPDPDCITCGGDGFLLHPLAVLVKAFVQDFKKRIGEREYDDDLDHLAKGRKRFYFKKDVNLENIDYIEYDSRHWEVIEYGKATAGTVIVYRWCVAKLRDK